MLWDCIVFSKVYGWDVYLVRAWNEEEAKKVCRKRLEEETDNPKSWLIMEANKHD